MAKRTISTYFLLSKPSVPDETIPDSESRSDCEETVEVGGKKAGTFFVTRSSCMSSPGRGTSETN